jgi:hypothetical protein
MGICAIFVGMGLTWATMCPPPPPPPDLAAIELREMREDRVREERQAQEKLDWFYGRKPKPDPESPTR